MYVHTCHFNRTENQKPRNLIVATCVLLAQLLLFAGLALLAFVLSESFTDINHSMHSTQMS